MGLSPIRLQFSFFRWSLLGTLCPRAAILQKQKLRRDSEIYAMYRYFLDLDANLGFWELFYRFLNPVLL